jgi:hypothetical protein
MRLTLQVRFGGEGLEKCLNKVTRWLLTLLLVQLDGGSSE